MPRYKAPITRRETAKGHYYVDANGDRIPGVTTILGDGLPKTALINWAANATADYAIDNWDSLSDLPVAERLKKLQGGRYGVTDKAKKRGTEVHGYAERLVHGEKVADVPELLRGHVEAYARFLDQFDVQPIVVEASGVNYTVGYAGTLDLIADLTIPKLGVTRVLADVKTNEKGIYGETALQLAAYRHFEKLLVDGDEVDMIEVQRCAAIHVTSESAELIPLTVDEQQWRDFRYAREIRRFSNESRDLVGAPIEPPKETTIASIEWREAVDA
ncbi:exonuclease [Gordonia phage Frokostdame]|uniref:Exonuclease n=1 Tax=Gordonia phage Frokostdame TaxID=2250320 RepID=A0A345L347_9CAUD|nr:exonuclease [Gordonia phage Frokostdame]AXH49699.1 exonuclease [Gordonia phage Frokostdame]